MPRLSVNLNKIALLRNSRHTGVPDLLPFATLAIEAGARGLTVHPRPDERHIRRRDVEKLAAFLQPRRPAMEYNIEGYPDARYLEIVEQAKPEQSTLVPDAHDAFTSDKGWDLTPAQMQMLAPVMQRLKAINTRVILFVDPDAPEDVLDRAVQIGAQGIEIYTGAYAEAFRKGDAAQALDDCARTAEAAKARGLIVNIGHDLNLLNLPPLVKRIPFVNEASIGHELTADALRLGFIETIRAYVRALTT